MISVRDTGRGIPADLLPRIFDLFYQGERTLARTEGGLGIGLTLVRSLVEQHGGTIEARSDGPGHGSEFIVRLPIADLGLRIAAWKERTAKSPETNPQSEIPNPKSQIRRVLLVEDNRETAEAQSELLELWGCEVRTVLTGQSALKAAAEFAPQVVLVDIGLPDLDGYEVARRLRADATTAGARLIALTGYGEERVRQQALAAGFDHHLTKPADPAELRRLVEKHP